MKNISSYAPAVLRLGLTFVVVWFGVSQLSNPNMWLGIVPHWATALSGMSAAAVVHANGWFEIITGLALGIGLWTRWVALLLSIHLYVIASGFGFSSVGVRDIGLGTSLLALAMFGNDALCYHYEQLES
jgi:uncharacterized membrane protein YphA (DoxX/SURF4 family)